MGGAVIIKRDLIAPCSPLFSTPHQNCEQHICTNDDVPAGVGVIIYGVTIPEVIEIITAGCFAIVQKLRAQCNQEGRSTL